MKATSLRALPIILALATGVAGAGDKYAIKAGRLPMHKEKGKGAAAENGGCGP